MNLKRPKLFFWMTLAAAGVFDYLFWGKVPGISFALLIITVLLVGLTLARIEGLKPAKKTLWLLVPIAYFTSMTFVRLEPLTTFLNVVGVFLLLAVFARSFLGGQWWQYSFKDYLVTLFAVPLNAIIRPFAAFAGRSKNEEDAPPPRKTNWRGIFAVLRGLLFALPVVLVLAALLAEADPIFGERVEAFLDFFNVENLGEYIFRGIYISLLATLLSGVFLYAFIKDHDEALTSGQKSWLSPFLGFTEAAIMLSSINLLYLAFVAVQFQYFFGGQANISETGYTYAEYARRGFAELVMVAFISLLVFLVLSTITKRQAAKQQVAFSSLATTIMVLVGVILSSSFQRLRLYEEAYGFTRLRTYTHVFIIWLGLLLLAVIVLELTKRQQHFALAAVVACTGFVVSLNSLNVDAFIARRNISRARLEEPVEGSGVGRGVGRMGVGRGWTQAIAPIDVAYLASLSEDVVPALSELYFQAYQSDDPVKETLAGALACHAVFYDNYDYEMDDWAAYTWSSSHISRNAAQRDWEERIAGSEGELFSVYYHDDDRQTPWNAYVLVDGEEVDCWTGGGWD